MLDKRVKKAREILDVLEENNKPNMVGGFVSILIGAAITISVGTSILKEVKKEL